MSALPSLDPLGRFMDTARAIAFNAADHGTHRLYERLKGSYQVQLPEHDHETYERVTRELARLAGV